MALSDLCHPSKCFVDLIKMKVHLGNTAVLCNDLVLSVKVRGMLVYYICTIKVLD